MPIVSLSNQDTIDVADIDDGNSVHSQLKAARGSHDVQGKQQRWSPFLSFLHPVSKPSSDNKDNDANLNSALGKSPIDDQSKRGSNGLLNSMVGSSLKNFNTDEMSVMTIDSALRDLSIPSTKASHLHRVPHPNTDVDDSIMTDDEEMQTAQSNSVECSVVTTNAAAASFMSCESMTSYGNTNISSNPSGLVGNVVKTIPEGDDKSPESTLTQTFYDSSTFQSPHFQLNNIPKQPQKQKNKVMKYSTQTYSDKGAVYSSLHKNYTEKSRSKRAKHNSSRYDVGKMQDDDQSISSYHGSRTNQKLIKQYEEASEDSSSVANILTATNQSMNAEIENKIDDDNPELPATNPSNPNIKLISPDSDVESQPNFFRDNTKLDKTASNEEEEEEEGDDDDGDKSQSSSPLSGSLSSSQSKLEMEIVRLNLELETTHSNLDYANTQIKNYQNQVSALEKLIVQLQGEKDIMKRHLMMLEKKNISRRIRKTKGKCHTCESSNAKTVSTIKTSRSSEESESSSMPSSSKEDEEMNEHESAQESDPLNRSQQEQTKSNRLSVAASNSGDQTDSQEDLPNPTTTTTTTLTTSNNPSKEDGPNNPNNFTDKDSSSDDDIPPMTSTITSSTDGDAKDHKGEEGSCTLDTIEHKKKQCSTANSHAVKNNRYENHVESILEAFDEDDPMSDNYNPDPFATLTRIDEHDCGSGDNTISDEDPLLLKTSDKQKHHNPMEPFRWDRIFKQRKKLK